ncbi:MAG: type IV toxin-antitoxin system AbiEi family antitoxin domain-containing protein [Chloroflexi bacterium]|nr:type IV toxin-antitoxin system AbiEi family antitoxin domain-containing protein [Chloroflexota bacterium]
MTENSGRRISRGTADIVAELELRNADVVTFAELEGIAGLEPGSPQTSKVIHRLVADRWLVPLPVRGTYEFIPGRAAGPFSREDVLDPLRGLLKRRPDARVQVVLDGAAYLRGFNDRPPVTYDILVPREQPVSAALRRIYRMHRVAPDRLSGAAQLDGLAVSTADRLLVDVALWPDVLGTALRHRDHWLSRALAAADPDVVAALLRAIGSPTVAARAGYLADRFGRGDIADAIATLGRSPVLVTLVPGIDVSDASRDRRFNVVDPVGVATVR